jgi:hypothetical protein
MRPALFYVSDAFLESGPSAREAEALRQARLAQVRSLLAEIAAEPCPEPPSRAALPRDAAANCCGRELHFA